MTNLLTWAELGIAALIERFLILYPHFEPGDLDVLLKRHLWHHRISMPGVVIVPNQIKVNLTPEKYSSFEPVLAVLAGELITSLTAYCQKHQMRPFGRFEINFYASDSLRRGQVTFECKIAEESELRS